MSDRRPTKKYWRGWRIAFALAAAGCIIAAFGALVDVDAVTVAGGFVVLAAMVFVPFGGEGKSPTGFD